MISYAYAIKSSDECLKLSKLLSIICPPKNFAHESYKETCARAYKFNRLIAFVVDNSDHLHMLGGPLYTLSKINIINERIICDTSKEFAQIFRKGIMK